MYLLHLYFFIAFSIYNFMRVSLGNFSSEIGGDALILTVLFSLVPILLGGFIGAVVDKLPIVRILTVSTLIVLAFFSFADLNMSTLFIMTLLVSILVAIVNIGCIKLCKIRFGSKGIYTLAFVVSFTGISAPLLLSMKERYGLESNSIVIIGLLIMLLLSLSLMKNDKLMKEVMAVQPANKGIKLNIHNLALVNTIIGSYMYVYAAFFFLFIPNVFSQLCSLSEIGFLMSFYGLGVVSIRLVISKTNISLSNTYYLMGVGNVCSIISLICFLSLLYIKFESVLFGVSSLLMGIGTGLILPASIVINQNLTNNLNSGKSMGRFTQMNKFCELIGVSLITLTYTLTESWVYTLLLLVLTSIFVLFIYFLPFKQVRTFIEGNAG
ncbi:UNVERIFIED_CONTAM: hypothetical protein I5919_07135 [Aeromonas hydrophila]